MASCTLAIGSAESMPNQPTIGEIRPARPKLTAPSSDAAVPASLPWWASAATWIAGNVAPVSEMSTNSGMSTDHSPPPSSANTAIAAADELTNDEDTLIIVTADHEHAIAFNGYCGRGSPILGLCMEIVAGQVEHGEKPELADDGKPYTVIGYLNGPGAVIKKQADDSYAAPEGRAELTQEEATDIDFVQEAMIPMSSESHSGEDVAIYAKGPFAHLFDGTVEQNYIFHVMDYAVKGGAQ